MIQAVIYNHIFFLLLRPVLVRFFILLLLLLFFFFHSIDWDLAHWYCSGRLLIFCEIIRVLFFKYFALIFSSKHRARQSQDSLTGLTAVFFSYMHLNICTSSKWVDRSISFLFFCFLYPSIHSPSFVAFSKWR